MKSAPIAIALTAFVFGFGGWYLHDRFGDRHEMPPPAPKPPPATAPDDNAARFAGTLQPVGNGEWSTGTVAPLAAAEPDSAPPGAASHSAALPAAGSRLAAYPLATRSWGDIYNITPAAPFPHTALPSGTSTHANRSSRLPRQKKPASPSILPTATPTASRPNPSLPTGRAKFRLYKKAITA